MLACLSSFCSLEILFRGLFLPDILTEGHCCFSSDSGPASPVPSAPNHPVVIYSKVEHIHWTSVFCLLGTYTAKPNFSFPWKLHHLFPHYFMKSISWHIFLLNISTLLMKLSPALSLCYGIAVCVTSGASHPCLGGYENSSTKTKQQLWDVLMFKTLGAILQLLNQHTQQTAHPLKCIKNPWNRHLRIILQFL